MTTAVYICDAVRTPIGRYGGSLSRVRADDLAAVPIRALLDRNPSVDWAALDDVIFGCANQSGEDSRNIARMASLLAGVPVAVSAVTVNRLCGSGLDAVAIGARAIVNGDAQLVLVGGVESMSRAPFVLPKAETAFSRNGELFDTTLGWRFVNPRFEQQFGVESMGETAENVAGQRMIGREDQDAFALRSQQRALAAQASGYLKEEIVPVDVPAGKGRTERVCEDEHPRETSIERLGSLKPLFRPGGTVTAGNASGINDGACALLLASESSARRFGLTPMTRVVAAATAGVQPSVMGLGPIPATEKLMERTGLSVKEVDVIELNEAFAAQALAVIREWGLADDAPNVNSRGGAIALGHPLGMSGARLATAASRQLAGGAGRFALCTMCIGIGQGIALILERV